MLFSILIANYNNGKYFKDCFDSIIAQTNSDWEAIIVDDHSSDNSVQIIKTIIKGDARFRLYENEKNYGCGFTKRKCVELANGEVCSFVDPDDTITVDALQLMIEKHIQHPDVSLVHSRFYYCNELLEKGPVFDRAKAVTIDKRFINHDASVTAMSSFKKKNYNSTEGLDAGLLRALDQDLYLKLSETGPFYFIDKPLYNYRIHDKGISASKADHAFYWYLKVIMKAEERRGVNLENEVAELLNRTDPHNLQINLANPRYLLIAMRNVFKKNPKFFFRKLFLNK